MCERSRDATRADTRNTQARYEPASKAIKLTLLEPRSAKFIDAVLGNLRCWTYLPHKKLFNYADFTQIHEDAPPKDDPTNPPCFVCGTTAKDGGTGTLSFVPKLLKCSRCANIVYCSQQCQRNDWKRHKPECIPKPKKTPQSKPENTTPKATLYLCENGCGFKGDFATVAKHEERCTFGLNVEDGDAEFE